MCVCVCMCVYEYTFTFMLNIIFVRNSICNIWKCTHVYDEQAVRIYLFKVLCVYI